MRLLKICAACLLLAGLTACEKGDEKKQISAPVVEFTPAEDSLEVEVGNSIAFKALLQEGGALDAAW